MEWIDGHCHLHDPWFSIEDINHLQTQFTNKNIVNIVNCASDPKNYNIVKQTSEFNNFYITLGIQPTIAGNLKKIDIHKFFTNQLEIGKKLVGIGEVGLDYYWVKNELDQKTQREVFHQIILCANELNQNLIIHSRKAETNCLDLLEKFAEVPVLLHSFDGNMKETKRAIDLGYKISIPTNVVIRRNRRKTVVRAGIDNILLETDSPFCAPNPDIERNDPSTIPIAGNMIAKLLELPIEDVAELTTRNAKNFYQL